MPDEMSVEVTDTAFDDAFLGGSWTPNDSSTFGLEAIAEFNATSNQAATTTEPQLTSRKPSTPPDQNPFAFSPSATSPGLNETLSQEPSPYDGFNFDAPTSPYYQSIETNAPSTYQPSPLRNAQYFHRRSVSEPPADMAPQMIFHRQDHFLGKQMHQPNMKMLKSLPSARNKAQRNSPYPPRKATRTHPHPQALELQHGFRPGVQRSHTQPVNPYQHAPTSSPMHTYHPAAFSPPRHGYAPPPPTLPSNMAPPERQQYAPVSTTRVCTPIPEAMMASPPMIDPALSQPSTPMKPEKRQTISIPVTMEELRAMIFDTVQKAVHGGTGAGAGTGVGNGKMITAKQDERSEGVSPKETTHVQIEEMEEA